MHPDINVFFPNTIFAALTAQISKSINPLVTKQKKILIHSNVTISVKILCLLLFLAFFSAQSKFEGLLLLLTKTYLVFMLTLKIVDIILVILQ